MTKTEPRSAGSGGGRDKTTPTEMLALIADRFDKRADQCAFMNPALAGTYRTDAAELRTLATTLSAREDGWQLVPVEAGGALLQSIVTQLGCDEESAHSFWHKLLMWSPKAPTAGEGK